MPKDERYDVVIVGGGPNGIGTAAYLAKAGLSVCVLEERIECGGANETVEPFPGVRIFPHAMLMYAAPAPAFPTASPTIAPVPAPSNPPSSAPWSAR